MKRGIDATYETGEGARPVIIQGLRGMGKTVLLKFVADEADDRGWIVVWVEASRDEGLPKKITRSLYGELRKRLRAKEVVSDAVRRAVSVFKSFQLKFDPTGSYSFGVEIEPDRAYAASGELAADLKDLLSSVGEAALDEGTAVLVAIDELQEASEQDLRALNMALHAIGQEREPLPIYFVGIGLPTLPAVLANASSYAERMYSYYSLDDLDRSASRIALLEPAEENGWRWEEAALDHVIDVAGGYPFLIQQCGYSVCERLRVPQTIDAESAQAGIDDAISELDRGIYKSRWDRATPRGRDFMAAMADDHGQSSLADITTRMGKRRPSDLSMIRDTLIRSGLIYSPERGYVAFTIPGMAGYIRRHSV